MEYEEDAHDCNYKVVYHVEYHLRLNRVLQLAIDVISHLIRPVHFH